MEDLQMAFHSGHNSHDFCRHLLAEVMKEVRIKFTAAEIKSAWSWRTSRNDFEFHGPHGEYMYNLKSADCKWGALAEGWQQLLSFRDAKCPICLAEPGDICMRFKENAKAPWTNGVHVDRIHAGVA
jgi:hypothetical protein